MEYYSPIDYLEPSDDPVKNALFELLIKTRIEENMTEADGTAEGNETGKLIQQMQGN